MIPTPIVVIFVFVVAMVTYYWPPKGGGTGYKH